MILVIVQFAKSRRKHDPGQLVEAGSPANLCFLVSLESHVYKSEQRMNNANKHLCPDLALALEEISEII
jgi:hypothetical protein